MMLVGRIKTAGAMFGLAVHWRIYPVIYAFPVAVNFIVKSDRFQDVQRRARSGTALTLSSRILTAIFNTDLLTFGMSSLAVLVGLGLLFFQMYGHEFLQVRLPL
jgi:phosphatidylinositol glycan class M